MPGFSLKVIAGPLFGGGVAFLSFHRKAMLGEPVDMPHGSAGTPSLTKEQCVKSQTRKLNQQCRKLTNRENEKLRLGQQGNPEEGRRLMCRN